MKNMMNLIKALVISIGLSLVASPRLTAMTQENVELATAFVRLPCAILAYKLSNDTSRSACLVKALIHAVRLVNDLCATSPRRLAYVWNPSGPFQANWSQKMHTLWIPYDLLEVFANLLGVIIKSSDQQQTASDDKLEKLFGLVVFPALEAFAALARTESGMKIQKNGQHYAGPLITLSRIGQLFAAAPQKSFARTFCAALFVVCVIDVVMTINKKPESWMPEAGKTGLDVVTSGLKSLGNMVGMAVDDLVCGKKPTEGAVDAEIWKSLFRSESWPEFWKKLLFFVKQINEHGSFRGGDLLFR